jgi:pyrroline-5-carboxylate reductase
MAQSWTVGFIGAGQMARALARGFVQAGLVSSDQVSACDLVSAALDQFTAEVPSARRLKSNLQVVEGAEVVFLAVKPQAMPAVLEELAGKIPAETLVISIAAGVTLAKLCGGLKTERVIRVMPNTPCLVGQGAAAYALGGGAMAADGELAEKLLGAVGMAARVDEKLLDAVTGLSGSGPAFVYMMIEALSDGGVRVGLPRDLATALAAQTVRGAAEMVLREGEHPAVLKDRVTSPGGTTIAGLQALEDRGLRGSLIAAVEAATRRSQELGNS